MYVCIEEETRALWQAVRVQAATNVEAILKRSKGSSSTGSTLVLVDDNMYYRSMRYFYWRLCQTCMLLPAAEMFLPLPIPCSA